MRAETGLLTVVDVTTYISRSVVEELHRNSLESEEFGRKAARAFGNVSQLEVSGVKLRDVVLRNIQTDFKSKYTLSCLLIFYITNLHT